MSPIISTQQHDKTATVQKSASPFGCQLTESTTTFAGAYWLSKGGSICYMLGYPAGLKAGAVVQPVVWPMVEGSEVYVRRHVVRQKVLPFIVGPPAGSCQACRKEKTRKDYAFRRQQLRSQVLRRAAQASGLHCCMCIIVWVLTCPQTFWGWLQIHTLTSGCLRGQSRRWGRSPPPPL